MAIALAIMTSMPAMALEKTPTPTITCNPSFEVLIATAPSAFEFVGLVKTEEFGEIGIWKVKGEDQFVLIGTDKLAGAPGPEFCPNKATLKVLTGNEVHDLLGVVVI